MQLNQDNMSKIASYIIAGLVVAIAIVAAFIFEKDNNDEK